MVMKQEKLVKIVGKRIRDIRKEKKISQEKLAELASLTTSYISKVETGKVNASLFSYYQIAEALNMPLSTLVMTVNTAEKKTEAELAELFNQARNLDQKKRNVFLSAGRGLISSLQEK
jgi:transcriptional regulator with XRE-family HTH domain